jgi:hypothetical protein
VGQREHVRKAIEAPVSESEKLLAELTNATTETKLSILISGWGRGLAAGLEELAIAIAELQEKRPGTPTVSAPPIEEFEHAPQQNPSEEGSPADLEDASEERLLDEAKRSREQTSEVRKESQHARRELEQ